MKSCIIFTVVAISLSGCHGVRPTVDNITVQKGLRMGDGAKVVDGPEVSVPIWNSKGLKEKPEPFEVDMKKSKAESDVKGATHKGLLRR